MSIDIEAIGKRNEERAFNHNQRDKVRGVYVVLCPAADAALDIDALLAEVARLREALDREFLGLASVAETAAVLGIKPP